MIEEYNAGCRNIETFFQDLVEFAQELNVEDKRAISENLAEEELAILDLLTKPDLNLTEKEKQEVKKVAQELLETLKREKLVLDWRKRQRTRAAVQVAVEEILDKLPQSYSAELYQQKCQEVYQHVYDAYFGQGRSIYSSAAWGRNWGGDMRSQTLSTLNTWVIQNPYFVLPSATLLQK